MIFVGMIRGMELAFRFDPCNAPSCYYDIRKLPRGTIRKIMFKPMTNSDEPKPYSGPFELEFEKLRKYKPDGKLQTGFRYDYRQ